jgi:predicted transcriptional regulator
LQIVYMAEIMRSDVKTTRGDCTVTEVVQKMNPLDVGSTVVVQAWRSIGRRSNHAQR